jgi:hypothetical protein
MKFPKNRCCRKYPRCDVDSNESFSYFRSRKNGISKLRPCVHIKYSLERTELPSKNKTLKRVNKL